MLMPSRLSRLTFGVGCGVSNLLEGVEKRAEDQHRAPGNENDFIIGKTQYANQGG